MRAFYSILVFSSLLFSSFASADLPIDRRSSRCPQITSSSTEDLIRFSPDGDFTVTIRNFENFATNGAIQSDELEVRHELRGAFGEHISQTQTLSYSELATAPLKSNVVAVPKVEDRNPERELQYEVIVQYETQINYLGANTSPQARNILHIVRAPEFNGAKGSSGNTILFILITPDGIICDEPESNITPLGSPLPHTKFMYRYHESIAEVGYLALESTAAVEQVTQEKERLVGETEQLERQNTELAQALEETAAAMAIETDTKDRAIAVAKRKAEELARAEAEIERLRSANNKLGTTLSKLMRGVFRLQKAIYKGLGIEATYRKLRKLQKKADKGLKN